jgi:crotonobetainyl-CoA:carnitine CoA-transferase CaiB-like acyl-CoA transferase
MLGDVGADVIKVERAGSGDIYRSMTFFDEWLDGRQTPCFLAWNRNKRSIALDLKSDEGKRIAGELAARADVIVENFRPGVMDRLGLGYEELREENPGLVYVSATGWGSDGPYAARPGQDLLVQATSGVLFKSGRKGDPPVPLGTALCDQLGALHIVYLALAALLARGQTGNGQRVEVNLFSCALAFQLQDYVTELNLGRGFDRPDSGIAHPGNGAPFGVYRTKDGYIAVAMNPWKRVCEALDDATLLEYDDPKVQFEKRDELWQLIQQRIATGTTEHWLNRMLELDLWVSEVRAPKDVPSDPQAVHLESFVAMDHPTAGSVKTVNIPYRMSATPGGITRHPPLVGEHSREILSELGYDDVHVDALFARSVVTEEKA